jgi:DNA-binding transcriptional MocR family regulator
MTGWRLGYAHGPAEVIEAMTKLQQYSFVCAPQPFQWAGAAALEIDMQSHIADYRRKRDLLVAGLRSIYELETHSGAFYAFPKAPWETSSEFVARKDRARTCRLSPATSSVIATRTSASPTPLRMKRSSAASKCSASLSTRSLCGQRKRREPATGLADRGLG